MTPSDALVISMPFGGIRTPTLALARSERMPTDVMAGPPQLAELPLAGLVAAYGAAIV